MGTKRKIAPENEAKLEAKAEKSNGGKPPLKQLFANYREAREEREEAKEREEAAADNVSKCVAEIAEHYGKGPFEFEGLHLTVTQRASKPEPAEDGEEATPAKVRHFFKSAGGKVTRVE